MCDISVLFRKISFSYGKFFYSFFSKNSIQRTLCFSVKNVLTENIMSKNNTKCFLKHNYKWKKQNKCYENRKNEKMFLEKSIKYSQTKTSTFLSVFEITELKIII